MMPGFGYCGLSKEEVFKLTLPQFRILLKTMSSFSKGSQKDKEEFMGEIPSENLNEIIRKWREERADN